MPRIQQSRSPLHPEIVPFRRIRSRKADKVDPVVVDAARVNSGDLAMAMVLEVDEVAEAAAQTGATVFQLVGLIRVVVIVPRDLAVE
tara:strand:+ start:1108 stop:1368 length:261 start_codon:yes stop_codon:yes gene_type:complete